MKKLWKHLGDENNRKRLSFIGALLATIVIIGWTFFQYSEKKESAVEIKKNEKLLIEKIEALQKVIISTCRGGSISGSTDAFTVETQSDSTVLFQIKNFSEMDVDSEITFNKQEWDEIESVITESQISNNKSYQSCVLELTPIFIEKFELLKIKDKSG